MKSFPNISIKNKMKKENIACIVGLVILDLIYIIFEQK